MKETLIFFKIVPFRIPVKYQLLKASRKFLFRYDKKLHHISLNIPHPLKFYHLDQFSVKETRKRYIEQGLLFMGDFALTQSCVSLKIFHQKINKAGFIIFKNQHCQYNITLSYKFLCNAHILRVI